MYMYKQMCPMISLHMTRCPSVHPVLPSYVCDDRVHHGCPYCPPLLWRFVPDQEQSSNFQNLGNKHRIFSVHTSNTIGYVIMIYFKRLAKIFMFLVFAK